MITFQSVGIRSVNISNVRTSSQSAAPTFGVSTRYPSYTPAAEFSGVTRSADGMDALKQDNKGEIKVQVLNSKQALRDLWSDLGQKPANLPAVNFKTQAVIVASSEANGATLKQDSLTYDGGDPKHQSFLYLTKQPAGISTSQVSFSWYLAVVPKDRVQVLPHVEIRP